MKPRLQHLSQPHPSSFHHKRLGGGGEVSGVAVPGAMHVNIWYKSPQQCLFLNLLLWKFTPWVGAVAFTPNFVSFFCNSPTAVQMKYRGRLGHTLLRVYFFFVL